MPRPSIETALEYALLGWHVIPLHVSDGKGTCSCSKGPDCPAKSQGKHPRLRSWQTEASADAEKIKTWWGQWPNANLGVVLGEKSGIIDLECDDAEAEKRLLALFDGELPVTPTFTSGRGRHRLFQWRPDLPKKATLKIGALDVKLGMDGKGSQSVFPPSTHHSGKQYIWVMSPDDCAIAPLPDLVAARIANWDGSDPCQAETKPARPKQHWDRVLAGASEGSRNMDAASFIGKLLHGAKDPFDTEWGNLTWALVTSWNRNNQPPMDEVELRQTYESIVKAEQRQRVGQKLNTMIGDSCPPAPIEDADAAAATAAATDDKTQGWKLTVRKGDPPEYRVYSPLWSGCVVTDVQSIRSFNLFSVCVQLQKHVWLPAWLAQAWKGGKNKKTNQYDAPLGAQLLLCAEFEEGEPERSRICVIADRILETIYKATSLKDGESLSLRGEAKLQSDSSVIFKFTWLLGQVLSSSDMVKRNELSRVLELVHTRKEMKRANKNHRHMVLTTDAVSMLEDIANGDWEPSLEIEKPKAEETKPCPATENTPSP